MCPSLILQLVQTHLVHVEDEVQFTDVFKAFIQRFYKHLKQANNRKILIMIQGQFLLMKQTLDLIRICINEVFTGEEQ